MTTSTSGSPRPTVGTSVDGTTAHGGRTTRNLGLHRGPITTIAWRVAHITDILAQERNATWLGLPPVGPDDLSAEATAAAAIERLERANAIWEQYLDAVDDDRLWQRVGPVGGFFADATRVAFVLHEIDELIHHGAEVALLRDLYTTRRP